MDSNIQDIQPVKKKNKTLFLIIGLCVIALVLVGVVFYIVSGPKSIMLQSINQLADNTKDLLGETNNNIIKKLATEDKVGVNSDIDVTLNGQSFMGFDLSYLENKKDEKSSLNVSLLQNNNSVLELSGLLANNRVYVKVKDIMDYYYTEFAYMSLFEEVDVDSYNKIIDIFKENIIEHLGKGDIKKSKETISYSGKEKKVTKLSYLITEELAKKVAEGTIKDIKKDKELVKALADLAGISEDELKNSLDSSLTSDSSEEEVSSSVYYNVYYYGFNNIVMYELADDEIAIQLYDTKDNFKVVFEDLTNKDSLFTLEATLKGSEYQIKGNLADYDFTGTYSSDDSNINLILTMNVEGTDLTLKLSEKVKEESDDKYEVESKLSLGVMGFAVQFNMDTTYKFGGSVDVTGIENAKDFANMTEEESNQIMQNIQNHPFISSMISLFSEFMPSEENITTDVTVDSSIY